MHEAGNKRYTVLVVDDDLDLLQLLTDGLELLGNFTVVSATDGVQGLERFFEIRPDCMMIDLTSSLRLKAEGFPHPHEWGFLVHRWMPSLLPSRFGLPSPPQAATVSPTAD